MENNNTENPRNLHYWKNPITYISLFILVTVILLIAANVLGFDEGETLNNLARVDFARGLITYLFAVGTIGVIIIVIIATLLGSASPDDKIKRAKDVLSILIGIFGTIVGYYFGSQFNGVESLPTSALQIAPIQIQDSLNSGAEFNLKTIIDGGEPPYSYWITLESISVKGETTELIDRNLDYPSGVGKGPLIIFAKDKIGNWAVTEQKIR
jgi:hypothetical protein